MYYVFLQGKPNMISHLFPRNSSYCEASKGMRQVLLVSLALGLLLCLFLIQTGQLLPARIARGSFAASSSSSSVQQQKVQSNETSGSQTASSTAMSELVIERNPSTEVPLFDAAPTPSTTKQTRLALATVVVNATLLYAPATSYRSLPTLTADQQLKLIQQHEALFTALPETVEDVRYRAEAAGASAEEMQKVVDAMAAKYTKISKLEDLEFVKGVPPVALYMRPDVGARWRELEGAAAAGSGSSSRGTRSVVRVACLFAGFVRDYENMLMRCSDSKTSRRKCSISHHAKFYGNLRTNIIEPLNCDVYASTWNIRGKGRFNVHNYDHRQTISVEQLQQAYGSQLAGLHVQNYSVYEPVWKYMHKYTRAFPQIRPTKLFVDRRAGTASFAGVPELNFLMRQNDYSQSYKHWCVVQLALLSQFPYDAFYRMRFDLRAVARLHSLRFAVDATTGDEIVRFGIARGAEAESGAAASTHFISSRRIHAHNFDISDFGYFGPVQMIQHLASVWFYCLASAAPQAVCPIPFVPNVPRVTFSEYNYMLWRLIFDNKWAVDSGNRYLYASRRFGVSKR